MRDLSENPASVYERERRRRRMAGVTKVCRFCGETKLRAEFVTYSTECLACRAVAKTCSECGERRPVAEFYPNGRGVDGLMPKCKPCARDERRAERERHGDRHRARDEARKEQRNARLRSRRLADPEWAQKQRARSRARHQRIVTEGADVWTLAAEAGWVCYLCGQAMAHDEPLEVDHVVPVALGGPDRRWNVAATHRACNRRKADHHPSTLTWVAATAAGCPRAKDPSSSITSLTSSPTSATTPTATGTRTA